MAKSQAYTDNGIKLSKLTLSIGDQLEITYKGLLSDSGADEILLYGGYGEEWNEKILIPMSKKDDDFKVKFKMAYEGIFHFAFKDPANNWDNNSGENYSIKVGKVKRTTRASTTKTDGKTSRAKTITRKASATEISKNSKKSTKGEATKTIKRSTKKQKVES